MINLANGILERIYDKCIFFSPILIVIGVAIFLVYSTYQANVIITATIIAEEGSSSEAASAGFINALTFIIPAIIGGFIIALLVKYRRKLTLKLFFSGALFFAGTFITFFFADSIFYLVRTQFYSVFILDLDPFNLNFLNLTPLMKFNEFFILMLVCCGLFSFSLTYIITSRKFMRSSKNHALLLQSAFMGAFLSVILPTYTVIILLVALSIYDIYSVRRGPIREIVEYSLQEENEAYEKGRNEPLPPKGFQRFGSVTSKMTGRRVPRPGGNTNATLEPVPGASMGATTSAATGIAPDQQVLTPTPTIARTQNSRKHPESKEDLMETDDSDSLLTNMTYSTRDWDVGIGDLVFYSMLASQPLTPYFIFNHAMGLIEKFGPWVLWLICLLTIIGIAIGFLITIKLLERNSMLPGLPCSIGLGLAGFLGSTVILYLI